jgi:hypothetical protein
MLRFLRPFKETDADPSFYAGWVRQTQELHGALFGYIEALIVLAALRFAANEFGGEVIWGVYYVAWVGQMILTIVYVRAFLSLVASRLPATGRPRVIMFWALGGISTIFAIWLVGAYAELVDALLAAGLGA